MHRFLEQVPSDSILERLLRPAYVDQVAPIPDAMFIASGIDENAEKLENPEKSTVSGDNR